MITSLNSHPPKLGLTNPAIVSLDIYPTIITDGVRCSQGHVPSQSHIRRDKSHWLPWQPRPLFRSSECLLPVPKEGSVGLRLGGVLEIRFWREIGYPRPGPIYIYIYSNAATFATCLDKLWNSSTGFGHFLTHEFHRF